VLTYVEAEHNTRRCAYIWNVDQIETRGIELVPFRLNEFRVPKEGSGKVVQKNGEENKGTESDLDKRIFLHE
jgi:hypothetical protein